MFRDSAVKLPEPRFLQAFPPRHPAVKRENLAVGGEGEGGGGVGFSEEAKKCYS